MTGPTPKRIRRTRPRQPAGTPNLRHAPQARQTVHSGIPTRCGGCGAALGGVWLEADGLSLCCFRCPFCRCKIQAEWGGQP